MELIDRLREVMEREYGIKTDADLITAVMDCTGPDLGIFVAPVEEVVRNAS